jgi:hypothetical protein
MRQRWTRSRTDVGGRDGRRQSARRTTGGSEQPRDDRDGLGQACDARGARIEREPRLLVFRLHVPGAQSELDASLSTSSVAASRAVSTGWRKSLLRTPVPTRNHVVAAAAVASAGNGASRSTR